LNKNELLFKTISNQKKVVKFSVAEQKVGAVTFFFLVGWYSQEILRTSFILYSSGSALFQK
jgi:hypothetical protein